MDMKVAGDAASMGMLFRTVEQLREDGDALPVDAKEAAALIETALSLPRREMMEKKAERAFMHGFAAGAVFSELIGADEVGWQISAEKAKEKVTKYFAPAHRIGVSTIRDAWIEYRTVAHIWAAYSFMSQNFPSDVRFPGRLDDLPKLLAVSEHLRTSGVKLIRQGAPVLDPGSTWRTAPELALPRMEVGFKIKTV